MVMSAAIRPLWDCRSLQKLGGNGEAGLTMQLEKIHNLKMVGIISTAFLEQFFSGFRIFLLFFWIYMRTQEPSSESIPGGLFKPVA